MTNYSRALFGREGFSPVKSVKLIWFLVCDQSPLAGLCMQDYKSLRDYKSLTCVTVVNIHTHTHTKHRQHFDQLSKKQYKTRHS